MKTKTSNLAVLNQKTTCPFIHSYETDDRMKEKKKKKLGFGVSPQSHSIPFGVESWLLHLLYAWMHA